MTIRGQDIVSVIKKQIEQFGAPVKMVDVGNVIEIGDGIARIYGLAAARYNELLQFPNDIMGIALNLEEDSVAAVILGDYTSIKEGDEVRCTGTHRRGSGGRSPYRAGGGFPGQSPRRQGTHQDQEDDAHGEDSAQRYPP